MNEKGKMRVFEIERVKERVEEREWEIGEESKTVKEIEEVRERDERERKRLKRVGRERERRKENERGAENKTVNKCVCVYAIDRKRKTEKK